MQYTIYQIALLFFLYAFLGWCLEVIFHAVSVGKFVNRGFLNGPVCPIYGVGAVAVILALTPIAENLLLLFLGSMLLTTALEYITGLVLEKIFHAKWWDYSAEPFNLSGYVCLRFSLMWGLACVFVMRIVHPSLMTLLDKIPTMLGWTIIWMFSALTLIDLVATVLAAKKLEKHLRALSQMAGEIHNMSDALGLRIADTTLFTMEKAGVQKDRLVEKKDEWSDKIAEKREQIGDTLAEGKEQLDQMLGQLEEKRQAFANALAEYKISANRFVKAFPGMKSVRYQDVLERIRERPKRGKERKKDD